MKKFYRRIVLEYRIFLLHLHAHEHPESIIGVFIAIKILRCAYRSENDL